MTIEVIELEDHFSGPAGTMANAAHGAEHAVAELRSRIQNLGGGEAQKLVSAFENMRGASANTVLALQAQSAAERAVTGELQKQIGLEAQIATFDAKRFAATKKLETELEKMQRKAIAEPPKRTPFLGEDGGDRIGTIVGGAALGAAVKALQIEKQIAEAAIGLVKSGAELAIASTTFREETTAGFRAFVSSQQLSEQLYDKAIQLSGQLGRKKEDVAQQMRHLLDEGFKASQLEGIVRSTADVAAARGEASGEKFAKLLETTQAKGKFDSKAVNQLAKMGIDTARVYQAIAASTGKSVTQVQALVKKGQIDASTGIEAMTSAAESKFAGFGERAGKTIPGLLNRLKNGFEGLFDKVDTSPFKDALGSLAGAVEGPAGAKLKGSLTGFFGTLFHTMFDSFKGPEGQKKLENMMKGLSTVIDKFSAGLKAAGPWIGKFVDLLAAIGESESTTGGKGYLTALADGIRLLVDGLTGIGDLGEDAKRFAEDIGALTDIDLPDLGSIGTGMIDGLVDGIEGGAAKVVDSLVDVCTSAISAAKEALGIASPSTVFASIGGFTAQGMAQGIAANDGAPAAAAASMASSVARAASVPPGSQGAAAPAGGGAGGGSVTFHISPVVHVKADDAAGGKAAAEAATEHIIATTRETIERYWRDKREEAA